MAGSLASSLPGSHPQLGPRTRLTRPTESYYGTRRQPGLENRWSERQQFLASPWPRPSSSLVCCAPQRVPQARTAIRLSGQGTIPDREVSPSKRHWVTEPQKPALFLTSTRPIMTLHRHPNPARQTGIVVMPVHSPWLPPPARSRFYICVAILDDIKLC